MRGAAVDHSRDAGGDDATLEGKRVLRQRVWEALREAGAGRFPGTEGRTPSPRAASSIKGAGRHARPVTVEELAPVDVVVVGSVAVDRTGARLGKGGGFADLEFAVASAAGLIGSDTVVVTTVHPVQIVGDGTIPMAPHDVPVDVIVTPEEVMACAGRDRPTGIRWSDLTDDKIAAIPLLASLRGDGDIRRPGDPPARRMRRQPGSPGTRGSASTKGLAGTRGSAGTRVPSTRSDHDAP